MRNQFLLFIIVFMFSENLTAQTIFLPVSKESSTLGDMHALTRDMGRYYQLEDTAKANEVITVGIVAFESSLKELSESAIGSSKSAMFIVGKIWVAYKRTLLAPRTLSNMKLIIAQTTQLMSACEYASTTFGSNGVTSVN